MKPFIILRYLFKKRKALRLYQKFPSLIQKNSSRVVEKNWQKVSSPEGRFCHITRHLWTYASQTMSFQVPRHGTPQGD